ncbi:hypothetical protein AGMMS49546_32070 [Spirochaetia bacterium]|nr:hypothetical protein AGMMS49546_32070 [Spirochaetia bacterium]
MAKISNEDRRLYFKRIRRYQVAIDTILKKEKSSRSAIRKNPGAAAFDLLALVDDMLNLSSHYIILNGVSQSMLKVKNEDALNEGRKCLYKSVIYLEQVVTGLIDAPFSEYEKKLADIAVLDQGRRYLLVRKMGLAIQLLERAYGEHTKWKWSFVELEGRYAAVTKNILDLKAAAANTNPESPHYEPTMYHLRLIKRLFMQAADRYREKYEISTRQVDDLKKGLLFLAALRRIVMVLGDRDEAEALRKKYYTWTASLEKELKRRSDLAMKN